MGAELSRTLEVERLDGFDGALAGLARPAGAGESLKRLWELGVTTITVVDAHISIVDPDSVVDADETPGASTTYSREQVDELIERGFAHNQPAVGRCLGVLRDIAADDRADLATLSVALREVRGLVSSRTGVAER